MISRRSVNKAGTRLNARGLDDNGNAANYVETEQLMMVDNNIYSFVITRGSVPIFWSQAGKGTTKLHEDVTITRSTEMTRPAFTKHFDEMISEYGKIHCVDLLKDLREREMKLTKEYYKLYHESKFKEDGLMDFLHFDFHRFSKGDNFTELRVLIDKLSEHIMKYGWGIYNVEKLNET